MMLREKIRKWYEGQFIPHDNDPYTSVVLIGGTYQHHWTASVVRTLLKFWLDHWQWIIGTTLAVCGLIIAVFRH